MSKELVKAISEIREDDALRLVEAAVKKGGNLDGILKDCQEAMNIVYTAIEMPQANSISRSRMQPTGAY